MQTINDKHNWFLIYHDIIQSSLFHAKRSFTLKDSSAGNKGQIFQKSTSKSLTNSFNASMRSTKMTSSLTASVMGMSTYSAQYSLRMMREKRTSMNPKTKRV